MSTKGKTPALRRTEFVLLIALLMSLVALSTNAMLPALPMIGRDLGAPRPNDVQFVITSVFLGVGIGQMLFGPLSALAMEPLGHVAGAGAAVVSSLSTLISVPLGILVGQRFDGTMYALIGAFAICGAATYAANVWARRASWRA